MYMCFLVFVLFSSFVNNKKIAFEDLQNPGGTKSKYFKTTGDKIKFTNRFTICKERSMQARLAVFSTKKSVEVIHNVLAAAKMRKNCCT